MKRNKKIAIFLSNEGLYETFKFLEFEFLVRVISRVNHQFRSVLKLFKGLWREIFRKCSHLTEYLELLEKSQRDNNRDFWWLPTSIYNNKDIMKKFHTEGYYHFSNSDEIIESSTDSESTDKNDKASGSDEQVKLLSEEVEREVILKSLQEISENEKTEHVLELDRDMFDGKQVDFYEILKHEYIQFKKWKSLVVDTKDSDLFHLKSSIIPLARRGGLLFFEPELIDVCYKKMKSFLRKYLKETIERREFEDSLPRRIFEYPDPYKMLHLTDIKKLFDYFPALVHDRNLDEPLSTSIPYLVGPLVIALVEERYRVCRKCDDGRIFEHTNLSNYLKCPECKTVYHYSGCELYPPQFNLSRGMIDMKEQRKVVGVVENEDEKLEPPYKTITMRDVLQSMSDLDFTNPSQQKRKMNMMKDEDEEEGEEENEEADFIVNEPSGGRIIEVAIKEKMVKQRKNSLSKEELEGVLEDLKIDELEKKILIISFEEHAKFQSLGEMFQDFEFVADMFGLKKRMFVLMKRINGLLIRSFDKEKKDSANTSHQGTLFRNLFM